MIVDVSKLPNSVKSREVLFFNETNPCLLKKIGKIIFKSVTGLVTKVLKVAKVGIFSGLLLGIMLSAMVSSQENLGEILTSHHNLDAFYESVFFSDLAVKRQNFVSKTQSGEGLLNTWNELGVTKRLYYGDRVQSGMAGGDQLRRRQYDQNQDDSSERESNADVLGEIILRLRREITSKEDEITEYDERFERYEDLDNDRAANSELGKKQQAQRERDALKDLLLQRQDEKILHELISKISSDEDNLVESLIEKLMYYARHTPSIDVDEDTKIAIVIQALCQSMSSEIATLKSKISAINARLETVSHDKSLYRSAKKKIRQS